ncbi:MAG: hypothetical protein HQL33_00215 [Alphaproteobacteria bacterium]|nr:hypothetical protein [Alphaproteobacteria bacterium]
MDVVSYGLVLAASLGLMGVGGLALPGAPFGRRFLAGLALVGGVCGALAWVAPVAVVPVGRFAIAAGWIVLLALLRRPLREGFPAIDRRAVLLACLAAGIGVGVALPFHFRFVHIGDNNYFLGQVVEVFLADYVGPLRIPTYYPWEVSASHMPPSMALAAMAALLPRATMLDALEVRFLLLAFVIARFSFVVLRSSRRSMPETALLLTAGLLVFHREINSAFTESTFYYIVFVFELALILFFDRAGDEERTARDALFVLLAMVGGKASIFYLPFVTAVWVAARFPRIAFHPAVVVGGAVTFIQLALTSFRPKPFADVSIKLSLFNPGGGRAAFDYYPAIGDALVNSDTVQRFLPGAYVSGILLLLLVIAVKYWVLPIRAIAGGLDPSRREILRIAEVFLLAALIGLVLVRHDQHGVTHQVWVFYGTAPLVLGAILARCTISTHFVGHWRGGLVAVAVLVAAVGYDPWSGFRSPSSPHLGGVTHWDLEGMDPAQAILPRPGENETAPCERALLKGVRLEAGSVPRSCLGTLGIYAVEPKK